MVLTEVIYARLARRAADRYWRIGFTPYYFARNKLRLDPVFRAALADDMLRSVDSTVIDVGCGLGLLLTLLAEARIGETDAPTTDNAPRLIGIELRRRVARTARRVLGGDAHITAADARRQPLPACDAVVLFDVLHLMPAEDQDALMRTIVAALRPGGRVLIREADAAAGARFAAVRWGNVVKTVIRLRRPAFHFRTADGWKKWLEGFGLCVRPVRDAMPFKNVFLVAERCG